MSRAYTLAAWALCLGTLAINLCSSANLAAYTPDALHYAVVARNLLRGAGYTVDFVPYHIGFFDAVRHVPEMHGLLRPLFLAPHFALFGTELERLPIPGLISVALCGLVAFYFARRLFGSPAGLAACLLTVTSASLYRNGSSGLDDSDFALFFLCTASLLHLALVSGRSRIFALAGAAAGASLLAKGLGILTPGLFVASLFRRPRVGPSVMARWLAWFLAPFLVLVCVVVARNYLAHGGLGFRFSPLEWIWKTQGMSGWTALHDPLPSLGELLQDLGWRHVVSIQWNQLLKFLRYAFLWWEAPAAGRIAIPGILIPLGLAAGVVHFARQREFAGILLFAALGPLAFVSLLAHFEARYYSFLTPLLCISVAGLLGARLSSHRSRVAQRLVRAVVLGLVGIVVVQSALSYVHVQRGALRRAPAGPGMCQSAVDWIRDATAPDEAVLVLFPAPMAWRMDRPAVVIPSGGPDPILEVARHYDAHWMLAQRLKSRSLISRLLWELPEQSGDLEVTPQFESGPCRVYRLDWPAHEGG